MDCSPPGSSVHGIFQARILEWVAIFSSRGIFPTQRLNRGLLYHRQVLYHLSHQKIAELTKNWILLTLEQGDKLTWTHPDLEITDPTGKWVIQPRARWPAGEMLWGKRVPSSCHSWQLRGIKALIASESRCCRWPGSFQYRESWPRESEQLLRQEECMGHNHVCSLLSWQNCQNSYSLPPSGIRGLLIRMGASELVSVLQGGQNLILWLSALLFSSGSDSKELFCDAGDLSSIPGSGRSPAGGNGNPLQELNNSLEAIPALSCSLTHKPGQWAAVCLTHSSIGVLPPVGICFCLLVFKNFFSDVGHFKSLGWITHYQRNANQNHNEVPLHANQDGCYPKVYKQ